MSAICLVIDRLHSGYLGAYGNSWIETPAFDRLAWQSFVFDQVLLDSPCLDRLYRSYWRGWHAMCRGGPPDGQPAVAAMASKAGTRTVLLTDEPIVARHPLAEEFDELVEIDPPWQPQTAGEIEETHLARCFAQLISWLESAEGPFLLWCHLGGLGTAWDAPAVFRRTYWEEGDPNPPEDAEAPDRMLPDQYDPDELLGITQSYAGQVTLLDACLGALLEFLDGSRAGRESLLTLTSSRGFPLGEHNRVGTCDEAVYGELVHVPLMIRFPGGSGAGGRSHSLVEPSDLWATLLEYWNVKSPPSPTALSLLPVVRGEISTLRDRLCVEGQGGERAIRTPAWYLRVRDKPELFAKPDDRWEINDVADRCHEVVECLGDVMAQYEQALQAGTVADLPPLNEVLLSGLA